MKKVNIKTTLLACASVAFLATGCDNADYKTIDNAIYWEEASTAAATKITVDPQADVTTSIIARIANPIAKDVVAEVEIDPDFLAEYNKANVTAYEVLPEQYCTYNKEITIKAGDVSAEATEFTIKPYTTPNGESYALPVSIKIKSGDVSTVGQSSKFILLFNQPLVQYVPQLTGQGTYSAGLPAAKTDATPWNETTNEWSIETWIQMDGFNNNNQAIINSGGNGTEVYIRFGDTSISNKSLQIKTQGAQVNTVTLFEKNKWYHLAIVYDASGLVTIYVNGVKDVTLQTKGGPANFEQMAIVSSGVRYFTNQCKMAQLRLWKVAISQTQITSNMYYGVRSDDPNLMGYWKLDEGEGSIFHDSTKYGHDMTTEGSFSWIPNQRFDK